MSSRTNIDRDKRDKRSWSRGKGAGIKRVTHKKRARDLFGLEYFDL